MQKAITIVIPFGNLGRDGELQQELDHPQLNALLSQGYEIKEAIQQTNATGTGFGVGSITFILENLDGDGSEYDE